MNPVHTFQPSFSRFILILSSQLYIYIPFYCSLLFRSPNRNFVPIYVRLSWMLVSTHPIMIYVVKSTNYESHSYAVCLPSCHFLSCLSVLHYTTHFTSLICTHFSQFVYFVCKRVCTSCEALTVVLLGIQVFQDVTKCCLDLLIDKYLHCG